MVKYGNRGSYSKVPYIMSQLMRLMVLFVLCTSHSSNAHVQPSSGARCLIFGGTLRLLPNFMCANSEGSGETAQMRRLGWAFAGRLYDKYHNLMSWLIITLLANFLFSASMTASFVSTLNNDGTICTVSFISLNTNILPGYSVMKKPLHTLLNLTV